MSLGLRRAQDNKTPHTAVGRNAACLPTIPLEFVIWTVPMPGSTHGMAYVQELRKPISDIQLSMYSCQLSGL